jgi:triosephosphate isomerase
MKPLVLVNFKVYPEAIGKKGILLAQKINQIKSKKYSLGISPTLLDLVEIAKHRKEKRLLLFAQHSDANDLGAHTGSITLEELKAWKIQGLLINHSENRLNLKQIKVEIEKCKKFKILSVVCASTLKEVKSIVKFKPEYIAYEPPTLIGGNVSVVSADPKVILTAVKLLKDYKTKLLCGAGIQGRDDLLQAIKLGASGVLIAHAVVQAKDPKKFLEKMLG